MIRILSIAGGHGLAGSFVVNVNSTNPAAISVALGVYTAFSVFAFGLNVPAPPLQVANVAPPPMIPASVTDGALAHTSWSAPAFTVASLVTNILTLSLTAGHGPAGSLIVNVNSTNPAATSAAFNV